MRESDAIQQSKALFLGVLGRDCAGLFWIAAELAILFVVLGARRSLGESSPPMEFRLTLRERARARWWAMAFVLLAAATLGRNAIVRPLYVVVPDMAASTPAQVLGQRVAEAYHTRATLDAAVWMVFITIWVVLETLIVWHGSRAAQRLGALMKRYPT